MSYAYGRMQTYFNSLCDLCLYDVRGYANLRIAEGSRRLLHLRPPVSQRYMYKQLVSPLRAQSQPHLVRQVSHGLVRHATSIEALHHLIIFVAILGKSTPIEIDRHHVSPHEDAPEAWPRANLVSGQQGRGIPIVLLGADGVASVYLGRVARFFGWHAQVHLCVEGCVVTCARCSLARLGV
jgi:hypothetical protein